MMLSLAELDLHTTFTWFLGLLALFAVLSMVPLRMSEERLQKEKQRLESQIVQKQGETMMARESASSWRLEMQRQFDAYRADVTARLTEAESRAAALQKQLEETQKQSWKMQTELQAGLDQALALSHEAPQLKAQVADLERALVEAQTKLKPVVLDIPPLPSVSEDREMALQKALRLAEIRTRNRVSRLKTASRLPRARMASRSRLS